MFGIVTDLLVSETLRLTEIGIGAAQIAFGAPGHASVVIGL
jgi:hypothetical protein